MVTRERETLARARVLDGDRRALTAGLLLGITAIGFEAMAVATVLPAVSDDLGGKGLYGWAFSAFMLATLIATIVAGQYADRRGPAVPYAAGLVLAGPAPRRIMPPGTLTARPGLPAGLAARGLLAFGFFGAGGCTPVSR